MMEDNIISGKLNHTHYWHASLESLAGKTVEAVTTTFVEGPHGDEQCILIHFTDGTKHGFVLPND